MRSREIIVSIDGEMDNVIVMFPPLCFSRENAKTFLSVLDEAMTAIEERSCPNVRKCRYPSFQLFRRLKRACLVNDQVYCFREELQRVSRRRVVKVNRQGPVATRTKLPTALPTFIQSTILLALLRLTTMASWTSR